MSSRLGGGEFQYTRGFNATRQEPGLAEDGPKKARLEKEARFLDAVFHLAPEARVSLDRTADALPKTITGGDTPLISSEKVRDWCRRWNITAPWCHEAAEQLILLRWLELQPGGEQFSWDALGRRASSEERAAQPFHDHLEIDCGFWAVTQQTRKEFERQCGSAPKRVLKTYCDRIEQQALGAGMERTPEKREFDHFHWLARRVVHGESASYMKEFTAALDNVSIRAINKAVKALALDLELTVGRRRENIIRQRVVQSVARTKKSRKRTG
jgi:hypothetical protein